MIFGIFLTLIVVLLVFFVGSYNGFIRLRNQCEEANSTMDVYLKQRWDLIPNLVETVKGYAAHERDTLDAVISARNKAMNSNGVGELQANENALAAGLKSLFALTEAYPDLKANQGFVTLQSQLQQIENDVLQSRKYFNAVIKTWNTKCEVFPHSIVAGNQGFVKKEYFEIAQDERASVKVSF